MAGLISLERFFDGRASEFFEGSFSESLPSGLGRRTSDSRYSDSYRVIDFDQVTDKSARSFSMFISSSYRPQVYEEGQS